MKFTLLDGSGTTDAYKYRILRVEIWIWIFRMLFADSNSDFVHQLKLMLNHVDQTSFNTH